MPRLPVALASAVLLAVGAASCSSDSETAGTTSQATSTEQTTTAQVDTTSKSPPPMAIPPNAAKRRRIYQELARARDRGVGEPEVYERVARREGVQVASVILIEHEGSLRRWPLPAAPKLSPVAVRVSPSAAAASRLRSSVACSANATRTGVARLRWRPAGRPAVRQWVVVTIFQKGFALNSFEASAPLSPKARSFNWRRIHGQAIHYWRVITRDRTGRWLGSRVAQFTGPLCVAEFEP